MSAPETGALLALQDLDTRLDQERHRRAHLPERAELAELEREAAQAQVARSDLAARLAVLIADQEHSERELKATEDRVVQVNRRLYGGTVTASRELQAMANDVEGLRKRASELEDKVLAVMEERGPLDSELMNLDDAIAVAVSRHEDLNGKLAAREAEVDANLAALLAQRSQATAAVPRQLLSAYERLRAHLDGVAVARLVGGRCDGCHLSLPAMELDRIRHQPSEKLEYCEQCGRILVIAG
jgi:hypothetical protein